MVKIKILNSKEIHKEGLIGERENILSNTGHSKLVMENGESAEVSFNDEFVYFSNDGTEWSMDYFQKKKSEYLDYCDMIDVDFSYDGFEEWMGLE